jgi:KaiC/GvpD/RAD55 family RecA-like ATPase
MAKLIETNIKALDEMLGGGMVEGSIVLLRGAPGSGKTTLALQILEKHLKNYPGESGVFISLEKAPRLVVAHMGKAYSFNNIELPGRITCIGRDTLERDFLAEFKKKPTNNTTKLLELWENADVFVDCVSEIVKNDFQLQNVKYVIIDSLNVFADMILQFLKAAFPSFTFRIRDVFQVVSKAVVKAMGENGRAILIFVGEYSPDDLHAHSIASESFFCDIDIQLTDESIIQEKIPLSSRDSGDNYPLEINLLELRKRIEKRHFCRVLKSRNSPRQSRRCTYDIVDGKGIEFYETYPADGQIRLFAENAPQLNEWRDFITQDILQMHLYPALDYYIFDRDGLQRTFGGLRRFFYMPERTDMYLSSIDSYWVSWYVDLWRRWKLRDTLQKSLDCIQRKIKEIPDKSEELKKIFSCIVGKIHRGYNNREKQTEMIGEITAKCRECRKEAGCKDKHCEDLPEKIVATYRAMDKEGTGGLLESIEGGKLRLFGERRSKIIGEIEKPVGLSAVPYNANIGLIVYRKDILSWLKGNIKKEELANKIKEIYDDIETACQKASFNLHVQNKYKIIDEIAENFCTKVDNVPQTWEGIIAICELGKEKLGKKILFLIETQTYTSLMSTLLEFIWNCGGEFHVQADYEVKEKLKARERLFQAFYIIKMMFDRGIIPQDCSLDPKRFAALCSKKDSEWLFARHWYSTFIDVLTARDETKQEKPFIWNPDPSTELEFMQIPVSILRSVQKDNFKHVSCWGEWYLGVVKGTENKALAIDLINNIMSCQKVCARAFSCAALPTTEEFYTLYKDAKAVNLPERDKKLIPSKTYKEIRNEFFAKAKSRSCIFDYSHSILELHTVLEYVRVTRDVSVDDLLKKIDTAIGNIEELNNKGLLSS